MICAESVRQVGDPPALVKWQQTSSESHDPTTSSSIQLRDYQQEALDAIGAAERRGIQRLLVALPTGTGKTVVFAHLIARRPNPALVLVHRDELIQQAQDKILTVMPQAHVGIVKAAENEIDADIVLASIQTLARPKRLRALQQHTFSTIIYDEAHHAMGPCNRQIVERLGVFEEGGPLLVGFTATPERADRRPLGNLFQEIVYQREILEMIEAGYLCDLRAIQIKLEADFNELHTRRGDFVESEASEMLMEANAPRHAVEAYRTHADGRKALLFTPTVELAHTMAVAFGDAGVSAAALDGTTQLPERRRILADLASGTISVLANCAVLTEGFDEPAIDAVMIARPTKSRPLYKQMIGRGTRPYPIKSDCLIIDLVGATTRHDLVTTASLFGVDQKRLQRAMVAEAVERQRQEQLTFEAQGRLVAETVDLFQRRKFNWVRSGDRFVLAVGAGIIVLEAGQRGWRATLKERGRTSPLVDGQTLPYAQGMAEDFARKARAVTLVDKAAVWRQRPATEKQMGALRNMRIRFHPGLTAGQASDLIAATVARW